MEALVDTSSDLTWLPGEMLWEIGVKPRRVRCFPAGNQQTVERQIGYAILRANGHETADEVVFAEAGDPAIIGMRTLEGFGVTMDELAHRFISLATLAALGKRPTPKPAANARRKTSAAALSWAA